MHWARGQVNGLCALCERGEQCTVGRSVATDGAADACGSAVSVDRRRAVRWATRSQPTTGHDTAVCVPHPARIAAPPTPAPRPPRGDPPRTIRGGGRFAPPLCLRNARKSDGQHPTRLVAAGANVRYFQVGGRRRSRDVLRRKGLSVCSK